jgi:hypothetical protein
MSRHRSHSTKSIQISLSGAGDDLCGSLESLCVYCAVRRARGTATGTDQLCKTLAKKVVADLKEMTDLGFGDESGLANVWEEICVQRQGEESAAWYAYEETVRVLIEAHLEYLSQSARRAIWLETDHGLDWRLRDNIVGIEPPICEDEIIEYVASHHVYLQADDFTNDRIAAFLAASRGERD